MFSFYLLNAAMEEKKSLRGIVDFFIQRDSCQDAKQKNSFKHMELCVELLVQGFEFVVLCLADRR